MYLILKKIEYVSPDEIEEIPTINSPRNKKELLKENYDSSDEITQESVEMSLDLGKKYLINKRLRIPPVIFFMPCVLGGILRILFFENFNSVIIY